MLQPRMTESVQATFHEYISDSCVQANRVAGNPLITAVTLYDCDVSSTAVQLYVSAVVCRVQLYKVIFPGRVRFIRGGSACVERRLSHSLTY